jgi:hypothetical protein
MDMPAALANNQSELALANHLAANARQQNGLAMADQGICKFPEDHWKVWLLGWQRSGIWIVQAHAQDFAGLWDGGEKLGFVQRSHYPGGGQLRFGLRQAG